MQKKTEKGDFEVKKQLAISIHIILGTPGFRS